MSVQINETVIIDKEKCTGCGMCVGDCLARAIVISDNRAEVVKPCFECAHCVAICPAGAVSFAGDSYDMADAEPSEGFGIDRDRMMHAIKARRSIRRYTKDAVTEEELAQIIEAGRFAPTAANRQNVKYVAVCEKMDEFTKLAMSEFRRCQTDEELRKAVLPNPDQLKRIWFDDDDFLFKGAKAVILAVSPNPVNASLASANMEMMAASMGLGALYVGYFTALAAASVPVREFLGLEENDRVWTCLALGRPDVKYCRTAVRKKPAVTWL